MVKNQMTVQQIIAWISSPKPPMPKAFPESMQSREAHDIRDVDQFLRESPR